MELTEDQNTERQGNLAASSKIDRPFRVIIVGGGVAGLAMSHALLRAGINHVVLEKGDVAPDWGASISTWGHGSRILSQIGCLEALEAAALPLKLLHTRGTDGKAFSQEPFFDMMKAR
jgi:2-polyprenyl-6-methoxyphenol hydroxylase-like FAD-dependent oxidoreductase